MAIAIAFGTFGSLSSMAQSTTFAASGLTTYNSNGGQATLVATNATISDPSAYGVMGARIFIDSNFVVGDYITVTGVNGITSYYDANAGALYLGGNNPASDYEATLRTLRFSSTNTSNNRRRITITLGDVDYNSTNGHYYKIYNDGNLGTFANYKAAAENRNLFGWQGYLVTITSQQEQTFVASHSNGAYVIGASDAAQEGTWLWVTGPEGKEEGGSGRQFSTQNVTGNCRATTGTGYNGNFVGWSNGFPSNCSNANYAIISQYDSYKWRDYKDLSYLYYVVEYGGMSSAEQPLDVTRTIYVDANYQSNQLTGINLGANHFLSNSSIGTAIGSLSTSSTGTNTNFTYSLVPGALSNDNSQFAIVGNELRTAQAFVYESWNTQRYIRVASTDGDGNTYEKILTITIDPVRPGVRNLDIHLTTYDPFNFNYDSFDSSFIQPGNNLQLITIQSLPTSGSLDMWGSSVNVGDQIYNWDLSELIYTPATGFTGIASFTYKATDNNYVESDTSAHVNFHIGSNNAPTDVIITSTDINELQPSGTTVGILSSIDPDATDTSFTYTLVSGAGDDDNASFVINLNKLQSGASFNYVTQNSYTVRVRTMDATGESFEKPIVVQIKHLPPVISDLNRVVKSGDTHHFSLSEFIAVFSVPNGMLLNTLSINTLPDYGTLELNGSAVSAGDILSASDLDYLTYNAPASFVGNVDFTWNATDSLGYFSDATAKVTFNVREPRMIGVLSDVSSIAGSMMINQHNAGATRIPSDGLDSTSTGFTTHVGSMATRNPVPQDPGIDNNKLANTSGNTVLDQSIDADILIHSCYPNPFSQLATIKYQLPTDAKVEVKVYNPLGVEVITLVSGDQAAGVHTTEWNSFSVGTGQYFYRINVLDKTGTQISSNVGVMIKL